MSETVNDCQLIECTNEADVDVYSTEAIPPTPLVPVVRRYGSAEVYWQCGTGTIILNTTLPSWIYLDTTNNKLVGLANTYSSETSASEATTTAQTTLDDYADAAVLAGDIICYDTSAINISTLSVPGATSPVQSAFDPIRRKVWTTWSGSTTISVVNPKVPGTTDTLQTQIAATAAPYGCAFLDFSASYSMPSDIVYVRELNRLVTYDALTYVRTIIASSLYTGASGNPGPINVVDTQQRLFTCDPIPGSLAAHYTIFDLTSGTNVQWLSSPTITGPVSGYANVIYDIPDSRLIVGIDPTGAAGINTLTLAQAPSFSIGTASMPTAAVYCAENQRLYFGVAVGGSNYGIKVIDVLTKAVLATVTLGTNSIGGMVYHEARKLIYVVTANGKFYTFDISNNTFSAMIADWAPLSFSNYAGIYCPYSTKVYFPGASVIKIVT